MKPLTLESATAPCREDERFMLSMGEGQAFSGRVLYQRKDYRAIVVASSIEKQDSWEGT